MNRLNIVCRTNIVGALFCVFALIVCFAFRANAQENFPLKIGMIADTQITTQRGMQNVGMRSRIADRFVNVAIRPVAVETHSNDILETLLHQMAAGLDKPDVILYLGDLANSGCMDEVEEGFRTLRKFRGQKDKGVPIFIVVGNHDFLGMGNTINSKDRAAICERNPDAKTPNRALSKYEFISRVAEFNKQSAAMLPKNYRFSDNFAEVSRLESMLGSDCKDHNRYYYAGVVSSTMPTSGETSEILLIDTSDYTDTQVGSPDTYDCTKGVSFGGTLGGISYKQRRDGLQSQIEYLRNTLLKSRASNRILASHYPPNDVVGALNNPLSENHENTEFRKALSEIWLNGQKNYWLFGHTHIPQPDFASFELFPGHIYQGVNVGSTTDYHPQAIVFGEEFGEKTEQIDGNSNLGFRRYLLAPDGNAQVIDDFKLLLDPLRLKSAAKASGYEMICAEKSNTIDPLTILGMNRAYRKPCWTRNAYSIASNNLKRFINSNIGKNRTNGKPWTRRELVETVFFVATSIEKQQVINVKK